MLGDEVLLFQPAPLTYGSGAEVDHRTSELPVVYVWPFDLLWSGSRGVVVRLPERGGRVSAAGRRGVDLPPLRRYPLPKRPRGRDGSRQTNWRLFGLICPNRRRKLIRVNHVDSVGPRSYRKAHRKEHFMRSLAKFWLLVALVVAASWAPSSAREVAVTGQGPAMASIGPLAFGPDGTLFAADNQGAKIVALDLGASANGGAAGAKGLDGINEKLAALLGTGAQE